MTSCATNTCGVGNWGGPLPGDPDNNSILTASPAFGGIDVSWSYPTTNPQAVAYAQLYRGLLSNFDAAILLTNVGGNFFYDKSTSNQFLQYFYWIKIVSVNGTVGTLIGPASAIAKPVIANVIEGLTAQIDAGLLAQSLKTEIDRITLNYQDLLDEVDERIAANTALSLALGQVQSGVTQALTFINEEITQRQEGDSAFVTQLNTVAAANASNLALIQQEQTARVDGDSANAQLYTTLNSQVNNATTGLPATRATLINDYYTKTNTDSAIATAVLGLVSTTAVNNALGAYTTTAALQQNYYTKTDANGAIAAAVLGLASTTAVNNALGNYTTTANLQTNYYTKTAADSAISAAITTSQTTFNENIAAAQTTLQTNINTTDGKVTAIGALYTAKVTVDGLIGGFGIYNDGTTVQAGFDVDEFWVGKTQANKRKPFIISNGVTYINDAAIEKLTFSKLRDESGSFVVQDGKVKADYLNVTRVTGGAFTAYAWPASGTGFYLGPEGLLLGNYNNSNYFQITASGNVYSPGFNIVNGAMSLVQANVVETINIAGNAVTTSQAASIVANTAVSSTLTVQTSTSSGGYAGFSGNAVTYPNQTILSAALSNLGGGALNVSSSIYAQLSASGPYNGNVTVTLTLYIDGVATRSVQVAVGFGQTTFLNVAPFTTLKIPTTNTNPTVEWRIFAVYAAVSNAPSNSSQTVTATITMLPSDNTNSGTAIYAFGFKR